MIRLHLPAASDAEAPYVARLSVSMTGPDLEDAVLLDRDEKGATFAGPNGIVAIDGATPEELDGDVVLVDPRAGRAERLIRAGSDHNTLLVTERCDQLCVMCSQPPKKTHVDRFDLLESASLLAPANATIGISGGEPTLFKDRLLTMFERVLARRPDLAFHVLSNAQHFDASDVERMRADVYSRVAWGIPVYAAHPALHDEIVGKDGAFARLEESFVHLMAAGARIELRTVLVRSNLAALRRLAGYVATRLRFVEVWSIMQLENIGFARNRWRDLFVDHALDFEPVGQALDVATLHGVRAQLFNFPRCSVPTEYRPLARASISDWKRKYMPDCTACSERAACTGFFEWHPDADAQAMVRPL